jgi:hypothetical protein
MKLTYIHTLYSDNKNGPIYNFFTKKLLPKYVTMYGWTDVWTCIYICMYVCMYVTIWQNLEQEKTLTTNVKRSPSCLGDCFCEHLKTAIFTSLGFEPFATCHRGSNTHHIKNICSNSLLIPPNWEFFSCNSFFWGGGLPGLYITTPKLQQKQSTKPIWQPNPPRNPNPKPPNPKPL